MRKKGARTVLDVGFVGGKQRRGYLSVASLALGEYLFIFLEILSYHCYLEGGAFSLYFLYFSFLVENKLYLLLWGFLNPVS